MRRRIFALSLAGLLSFSASALAANTTLGVTAGAGTNLSLITFGSGHGAINQLICDPTTEYTCAAVGVSGLSVFATQNGTWAISAASLPLPTGAATAAKQPALGTAGTASTDVLTVQGIAAMTPLLIAPGTNTTGNPTGNATAPVAVQEMVSDGTNLQRLLAPLILGDGVNGNNMLSIGNWIWNGTTWDRQKGTSGAANVGIVAGTSIIGKVGIDQTTDVTTNGVEIAPTAGAAAGIAAVVSAAAEANHVIKASAGNLYGFEVTSGATAGFVMVYNATSAPVDGAVTPTKCYQLPANSTIGVDFKPIPLALSTGITIGFSATGCFTKTASATAFISAGAK